MPTRETLEKLIGLEESTPSDDDPWDRLELVEQFGPEQANALTRCPAAIILFDLDELRRLLSEASDE